MRRTGQTRTYRCSICGRESAYAGRLPELYPFCSARCRMVDLGRWLNGQYSIDRDLTAEELGEADGGWRNERDA